MVNAVTGSDFLPSREPVSGSGKNDSTDFRDALQQASKGQKEDSSVKEEASTQGKDAPAEEDGIRPEADGDQLQSAAGNAAGLFPWMALLVKGEDMQTIPGQTITGQDMAVQLQPENGLPAQTVENGLPAQTVENGQQSQAVLEQEEAVQVQQPLREKDVQMPQEQQARQTQPAKQEQTAEEQPVMQTQPGEQEEIRLHRKEESAPASSSDAGKEEAAVGNAQAGIASDRVQLRQGPEAAGQSGASEGAAGTDRPVPMEELPQAILSGMKEGRTEFEIRLEPEALGKMVIKASLEEGRAVVSILCSNSKTAEILSVHAREIGAIMEANLGTPANIVLDKGAQENASQDYPDGQANQNGREEQQNNGGKRQNRQNTENFLQQLRLGLV